MTDPETARQAGGDGGKEPADGADGGKPSIGASGEEGEDEGGAPREGDDRHLKDDQTPTDR